MIRASPYTGRQEGPAFPRRWGRKMPDLIKLEERDTEGDAVLSPLLCVTARVLTSHQKAGLCQAVLMVEMVSGASSFLSSLTVQQGPCPHGVQTGVPWTGCWFQLWSLTHPCEQHFLSLQAHIWHQPWNWAQQWVRQVSSCLFRQLLKHGAGEALQPVHAAHESLLLILQKFCMLHIATVKKYRIQQCPNPGNDTKSKKDSTTAISSAEVERGFNLLNIICTRERNRWTVDHMPDWVAINLLGKELADGDASPFVKTSSSTGWPQQKLTNAFWLYIWNL